MQAYIRYVRVARKIKNIILQAIIGEIIMIFKSTICILLHLTEISQLSFIEGFSLAQV